MCVEVSFNEDLLDKWIDADFVFSDGVYAKYIIRMIALHKRLSCDFILKYAQHIDGWAQVISRQEIPPEIVTELQMKGYITC